MSKQFYSTVCLINPSYAKTNRGIHNQLHYYGMASATALTDFRAPACGSYEVTMKLRMWQILQVRRKNLKRWVNLENEMISLSFWSFMLFYFLKLPVTHNFFYSICFSDFQLWIQIFLLLSLIFWQKYHNFSSIVKSFFSPSIKVTRDFQNEIFF